MHMSVGTARQSRFLHLDSYGMSAYKRSAHPAPYAVNDYTSSKPPSGRSRGATYATVYPTKSTYKPAGQSSVKTSTSSGYGGYASSPRPLPPGPGGPYDEKGRRITISNSVSNLKNRYLDTTRVPLRGPVTSRTLSPGSSTYTPSTYTPSSYSPSSYEKPPPYHNTRAGSVSSIAENFESLSLRNPKRYGSNVDIATSSRLSTPVKTEVEDLFGVGKDLSRKSSFASNHGHDRLSNNLDSPRPPPKLPDIGRSNRSSRSPSLDRKKLSRDATDDEVDAPGGKRNYKSSSLHVSSVNGSSVRDDKSPEHSYNKRGLVGLRNLGNTCFMNSVIQCLSNTKPLLDYCRDTDYERDINKSSSSMKGALVDTYASVMRSLWHADNNTTYAPNEFKSQIAKFARRFMGYSQQDAQEFLIYLLEGLHEDLNRVKEKKKREILVDDGRPETISPTDKARQCWKRYLEYDNSKIVDIFVGQLRSSLTCTVCGYQSNTFDPYWDLSLPLRKGRGSQRETSLLDCLEEFTRTEELEGDERPTCARCKKRQKCTKQFLIQKFPKVLIIHLKRFSQETSIRSKLSMPVKFPLSGLDLTKFAAETGSAPAVYSLFAVSNHSGTTYGGHYTAYAKNPFSGQWHSFNDTRVSPVTERQVVSSEAYVLFYELDNQNNSSRL